MWEEQVDLESCEEDRVGVMSFKTTQAQKTCFNFKDNHSRLRMALIMLKKIHVKLCYSLKNPLKSAVYSLEL